MSIRFTHVTLAVAVLVAGCATQPNAPQAPTGSAVRVVPELGAVTQHYVLQSAGSDPVRIGGVTASSSSTRDPRWFEVNNVIDGNTHSAWGPAEEDDSPTLTLDLGGTFELSGLGLKMSEAPATVDVAVRQKGVWVTVATNVSPTYGAVDFIDLPNVEGDQVRLTFDRQGAQLLVCEVQAFTGTAGQATPTPVPSVSPPAETCASVAIDGALFAAGASANDPPLLNVEVQATVSEGKAFGKALISVATASTSFEGVVTGMRIEGDVLTISGVATSIDNTGPIPGVDFTIEVAIDSRTEGSFQGHVTGLTIGTRDVDVSAELTTAVSGTTSDCPPYPLGCFTIEGTQSTALFANLGGFGLFPIATLGITDLTRFSTGVSGTLSLNLLGGGATPYAGTITEAEFDDGTLNFGGTLVGGGTFSGEAIFLRSETTLSPNAFTVTPVRFTASDASGNVIIGFENPVPGLSPTGAFTVTYGCE